MERRNARVRVKAKFNPNLKPQILILTLNPTTTGSVITHGRSGHCTMYIMLAGSSRCQLELELIKAPV